MGPHGCQCSPLGASTPDKAAILGKALEPIRERFPKVAFVPWADATRQRHDMHEAPYCAFEGNRMNPGGFCCDCTHVRTRDPRRSSAPPRLRPCAGADGPPWPGPRGSRLCSSGRPRWCLVEALSAAGTRANTFAHPIDTRACPPG